MARIAYIPLERAVTSYLDASRVQGNASRWIDQQSVILTDFMYHMQRDGARHAHEAEAHHLMSYLSGRILRGDGPTTIHRKGTVIRAWARWLDASGMVRMSRITRVDLKEPPEGPLELEDFQPTLEAILSVWKRDYREAFLVLLGSGLRRGELLALRWMDCDLAEGVLMVRPHADGWSPKSRRERAAGIPPWVVEVLALRKTQMGGAGPFLDAEGAPIFHESTLSHVWLRLARSRGLKMRLHDLRHAHATELLRLGTTIREVQAQLGHAAVTTTERYTHVDRKAAKRAGSAMAASMPSPNAEAR